MTASNIKQQIEYHTGEILKLADMLGTNKPAKVNKIKLAATDAINKHFKQRKK